MHLEPVPRTPKGIAKLQRTLPAKMRAVEARRDRPQRARAGAPASFGLHYQKRVEKVAAGRRLGHRRLMKAWNAPLLASLHASYYDGAPQCENRSTQRLQLYSGDSPCDHVSISPKVDLQSLV